MKNKKFRIIGFIAVLLGFLFFSNSSVYADTNDYIDVSIATSCSMTGTIESEHTAVINPGTYNYLIGETSYRVFCNDESGFSVYAVGYSNEEYGNTSMIPENLDASLNSIITGTSTSGDTSNWAMKLSAVSGAYAPTLTTGYNAFHVIPSEYTKVATYAATTDNVSGSAFKTTYSAYVNINQLADTYNGKVKYILIHPASISAPAATATSGQIYYSLTGEENDYTLTISNSEPDSNAVLSGEMPLDGFATNADIPWYVSYRDQITSAVVDGVVAPRSTKRWFYYLRNCSSFDLDGLYMNNATDMSYMFYFAGYNVTSELSLDVSNWDTSNVTNMAYGFAYFGRGASSVSITGLKRLDTSNVTNMQGLFTNVGYSMTGDFSLDLTGWDTSSVERMNSMFTSTGYNATTWTIKGLEGFDTRKVQYMNSMFSSAGYNVTGALSINLTGWDTSSVGTMASMFSSTGYNASSVSFVGIENWDVSSVTTMSNMFTNVGYYADNFYLDLSGWTTTSLENVSSILYMTARRVPGEVYINLSGWDTSHVTNTTNAFAYTGTYWASKFYLSIAGWDMSAVETITNMFQYCGDGSPVFAIIIPPTNGNGVANSTTEIHGKTADIVAANPLNGFYFTLAESE